MNILIVDDNANNRMVLKLLLSDFSEDRNISYELDECENGLLAVNKATAKKYDLIFMDIMMAKMDGIEATKKIREIDHDVMIIAVSAVEDDAKQKEILRNGAEDYVAKPIDSEQLFTRLENYFSLLSLRKKEPKVSNSKFVNLYTKNIFHRQTIFYVENEETLSEFWEYYLLGDEPLKVDGLSDVVRLVFTLGDAIVKLSAKPWIIVEADYESIYFTLNKVDVIGPMGLQLILKKNKEVLDFKHNEEKISFKLEKRITSEEGLEVKSSAVESQKKEAVKIPAVPSVDKVDVQTITAKSHQIFNYMDPEDLDELEELLGDLSSLMLMLGNSDIEEAEIDHIVHYLQGLGKILGVYTESYAIGRSLANLAQEIAMHKVRFYDIANDLSTLSSAFVSDLQTWVQMTFYKGAPSVDFMDATIVANSQTISSMLSADESVGSEAELDDIFDF